MRLDRGYYISALPSLGDLGTTPPMNAVELLDHLRPIPAVHQVVEALFLLDDVLQREAFLAGERQAVEPTVLTPAQARNEAPLPAELAVPSESAARVAQVDGLWEAAFRHADAVARERGNGFLTRWVAFEVALRNALASARAKRLKLDESQYGVAVDLSDPRADLTQAVNEWLAASTPLAGLQALIRVRWAWVHEHDAWFSFRDDELAAYAAKLMLLHQWKRVADAEENGSADTAMDEPSLSLERATR
ncbi:MAG: DUF2764 family protein [Phycisphaerae bacterium]|nr:DUF2764 family protein [Phycisphaerae bacterium]